MGDVGEERGNEDATQSVRDSTRYTDFTLDVLASVADRFPVGIPLVLQVRGATIQGMTVPIREYLRRLGEGFTEALVRGTGMRQPMELPFQEGLGEDFPNPDNVTNRGDRGLDNFGRFQVDRAGGGEGRREVRRKGLW